MKAFAVVLCAVLAAAAARADTLNAGPGKRYASPSAAIKDAEPGDTVAIYPGQYFDCATVRTPRLTIEGVGNAADVVLTDKTCDGKAILVLDAPDITVRNLTLTRARVTDNNGAGIRMEGGSLTVEGVRFINDQDGILTAANPAWVLKVSNSLFERNGVCRDYCSHAIYAGEIGQVIVRNSVFRATRDGHNIKSRAARTEVIGNTIEDGPDGTSSYLIEAPNGGSLIVRNNTLEKGPHATNTTCAIMIGSEGVDKPTPEIDIEGNDFTNDMVGKKTFFVDNVTATEAILRGNHLHGKVQALEGDGSVN
ncbi:MAG TPA: right-handed parallel beta-helix repeat-containing protein [Acetobacteraceae bacterium]|nr:right-handed parallel beta-helix repeat-containing protein [Acetobacteraceae bacterium]